MKTRAAILTIGTTLALLAPGPALASLQSTRSLECVIWGDGVATATPTTKTTEVSTSDHPLTPALTPNHHHAGRTPI